MYVCNYVCMCIIKQRQGAHMMRKAAKRFFLPPHLRSIDAIRDELNYLLTRCCLSPLFRHMFQNVSPIVAKITTVRGGGGRADSTRRIDAVHIPASFTCNCTCSLVSVPTASSVQQGIGKDRMKEGRKGWVVAVLV